MKTASLILAAILVSALVFLFLVRRFRPQIERFRAEVYYRCGISYDTGTASQPKDPAQARACWRKAADMGNADAQAKLGWLYFHGIGVPQHDATAVLWSDKAARQGNVPAQALLGYLYFHGKGVARSHSDAYFWLSVALVYGHNEEVRQLRAHLISLLPVDHRAAIEERVRAWRPAEPSRST